MCDDYLSIYKRLLELKRAAGSIPFGRFREQTCAALSDEVVSLDDKSVTQNFYIATESSPADDRTRVLKYGNMFAVFDRYGDIETRPEGTGNIL